MDIDLEFLEKYLGREVDIAKLKEDPELQKLLKNTWDQGYNAGFEDGDGDSYAYEAHCNPFI